MFCLLIHSVDSLPKKDEGFAGVSSANREPPGSTSHGDSTATSSSLTPNAKPRIQELHGIVHLYRRPLPLSSSSSAFPSSSSFPPSISDSFLPASRGMLLFVLAVPGHLSPQDFLRFCGSYADCSAGIQVIRNDGMEDRYSVLVNFDDQKRADAFYLNLNGWRFSSVEVVNEYTGEICHILFLASLEFTESAEIACSPPLGSTELPTCPVCIGSFYVALPYIMVFLRGMPILSRTFCKTYLLAVRDIRKSLDMRHMWFCWMWKIMDEYNRLLASQLENQRVINENLMKSQNHWREKIIEIEQSVFLHVLENFGYIILVSERLDYEML
ncbi:hypothetical protein M5K25_009045 [Dendrobium thyrsiflorum]|uniref:BRCA1-associated 2/ETP1 RRM domain-containing protein n=1 Tax=Dendrobium thyrsiflorum TaxID=117978 RepID=A0ABD0V408_DENTH